MSYSRVKTDDSAGKGLNILTTISLFWNPFVSLNACQIMDDSRLLSPFLVADFCTLRGFLKQIDSPSGQYCALNTCETTRKYQRAPKSMIS